MQIFDFLIFFSSEQNVKQGSCKLIEPQKRKVKPLSNKNVMEKQISSYTFMKYNFLGFCSFVCYHLKGHKWFYVIIFSQKQFQNIHLKYAYNSNSF